MKLGNGSGLGLVKLNPRSRIPDDQVHFARQIRAAKQRGYLVGILRPIVYPAQQNILKGHPFLRAKRHLPHRVEHDQPVVDVSPCNDWTQVRVWYEPAHALGRTVYPTYGFILPN